MKKNLLKKQKKKIHFKYFTLVLLPFSFIFKLKKNNNFEKKYTLMFLSFIEFYFQRYIFISEEKDHKWIIFLFLFLYFSLKRKITRFFKFECEVNSVKGATFRWTQQLVVNHNISVSFTFWVWPPSWIADHWDVHHLGWPIIGLTEMSAILDLVRHLVWPIIWSAILDGRSFWWHMADQPILFGVD